MRAFLAIYPDESARGELAEVAPDDADDVRVTDMADWHVTLRFLGELDEGSMAKVSVVVHEVLGSVAPCTVRLGPTTALGTGARVLFVPATGAERAAKAVDDGLGDLVEPREGPFSGHLTLARARGRGRLPAPLSGQPVHVSFVASEVALVVSRLEPDRAVHQVLRRFTLGAPVSA